MLTSVLYLSKNIQKNRLAVSLVKYFFSENLKNSNAIKVCSKKKSFTSTILLMTKSIDTSKNLFKPLILSKLRLNIFRIFISIFSLYFLLLSFYFVFFLYFLFFLFQSYKTSIIRIIFMNVIWFLMNSWWGKVRLHCLWIVYI